MALKIPDSMGECFYFTRRSLEKGKIMAWVKKPKGPGGGLLQKPLNPKTGKPIKKSEFYVEQGTDYQVDRKEIDPDLEVEIVYTCPACGKDGETIAPYVWKTFKGAKSVVFHCVECNEKIGITKKMKGV